MRGSKGHEKEKMTTIMDCVQAVLGRSRKSDPISSKLSAAQAQLFAESHADKILAALNEFGWMTASEIGFLAGLTNTQVCRRLPEMQREKLVARTGASRKGDNGKVEMVWKAI